MAVSESPHGRSRYRHHGCRCVVCVEANRVYMRGLRARKRGLTPVPLAETLADRPPSISAETSGPVVAAVRRDLERLGDLTGWEYLAAAAIAMARILDHPGAVTTQPAAAKQLMSLMDTLRENAAPKRGKLAAIQAMSRHPSRPDAG